MSDETMREILRDDWLKAVLGSRNFVVGALITAVFVFGALLSLIWTPYDPAMQNIPVRFQPPSTSHWLGTDHFGRDIFSMVMAGARTSMAVAFVAVSLGIAAGTPLGLLAAASRQGSLVDEVVSRSNDLIFAFPALLIAVLISAIFGPGLVNTIIAIAIFNVPVFARLSRGAALSLWSREFILSARVAGKGAVRISVEHILPNILNTLIVQGTIAFALGILAEAALSYVGLGAQPPIPSWGKMLADAQTTISLAPHVALVPGLAIVAAVLGINLMGDGLRDILDPQLRRSRQ
jgi:peptide/nickel transport system permease protein